MDPTLTPGFVPSEHNLFSYSSKAVVLLNNATNVYVYVMPVELVFNNGTPWHLIL